MSPRATWSCWDLCSTDKSSKQLPLIGDYYQIRRIEMVSKALRLAQTRRPERGVALVASLMTLLLLTAMGLTIALIATTETAVSANYRRNEQAFFSADAGVGIARESLRIALNNVIIASANTAAPTIDFPTSSSQAFDDRQVTNLLTASSLTASSGTPAT